MDDREAMDDRTAQDADQPVEDLDVEGDEAKDVKGGAIINAWPKKYTGLNGIEQQHNETLLS